MNKQPLKPIWVKPKTHLKVKKEAVRKKVTMSNLIDNLIENAKANVVNTK
jgi:hypothetical protein